MASLHLARYAASTARLRQVLERKIRRRCALQDVSVPDDAELCALLDGVVARLTCAGLLDDAAYGRGRAAVLARKGWPGWRITAELGLQGIDFRDDDGAALDLDEVAQATRLAERKRLGPFRLRDRASHRDKDIASLARAGFAVSVARGVIDGSPSS